MNEGRWIEAQRLARHLRRVADAIECSLPPIDDLSREFDQGHWLLTEIQKLVKENKQTDTNNIARIVFGSTLSPKQTEQS